jgi:peptidoglycan/LPS O-acetylase OafA/YrhL
MPPQTAHLPGNSNQNNFHLVRLLAAMQVVITHSILHLGLELSPTSKWLFNLFSFFPGVPVFFVVSGYLVSGSFERSKTTLSYAAKRFLRIYPALWVAFIVSLLVIWHFGLLSNGRASSVEFVKWCSAQTTIAQFYNPPFLRVFGVGVLNGSLWTIPIELSFYLVLPALYKMLIRGNDSRTSNRSLLVCTLLLAALPLTLESVCDRQAFTYKILRTSPLPYLYLFLLGVLLQREASFLRRFLADRFAYWAIGYAGVSCATLLIFGENAITYGALASPLKILLGLVAISLSFSHVQLSDYLVGKHDISYGVYLYHMIILNALLELGRTGLMSVILTVSMSLVAGWISWRMIELPCLRIKSKNNLSFQSNPVEQAFQKR